MSYSQLVTVRIVPVLKQNWAVYITGYVTKAAVGYTGVSSSGPISKSLWPQQRKERKG